MLDALLARGIPIVHSCRRGDCGQCAVRVLESEQLEHPVGSAVQLCRLPALSAGVYELDYDPYEVAAAARTYPAKVVDLTEVARGVVRLRVRTPPNRTIEFKGGQYAFLILKAGLSRSYSIANVDPATNEVDFYIKRVKGGAFGGWLANVASPGDLLQIHGPLGLFRLRRLPARTTWLVATGTGIVPILAMLRKAGSELISELGRIEVLWGNRTSEDVFCSAELAALREALGISFRMVFSREGGAAASRVTDILAQSDLADCTLYAAGHPDMVRDVDDIGVKRGLAPGRFFSDAFAFSPREKNEGTV